MRHCALCDEIVRVETDMVRGYVEGNRLLSWRKLAQRRYARLHDEASFGSEMPGRVAEALDLRVLREEISDRVEDEIDERELPVHARGRHVSDDDGDAARLLLQDSGHGSRVFDPGHVHAPRVQGDRNTTGADRELQSTAVRCEFREERGSTLQQCRGEHSGGRVVVSVCLRARPQVARDFVSRHASKLRAISAGI